jgi:CBS domain-containing membrane protein
VVVAKEIAMRAQDVMTPNPTTVPPHATVAEVWDLMRERAVRHLPVVDRGSLVGMLSDRDLAHFDLARLLTTEGADALRRELGTPAVKVMSADVIAVNPEAELGEVVDLLVENRIGAVAVVRPETQELVGIVSYIDVLEALRDQLEVE